MRSTSLSRHQRGLTLLALLTLAQLGHQFEHLVQVVQLHVLGQSPAEAHGAVGRLDIEWVHFIWNTGILVVALLIVVRFGFRSNPWLWVALAYAGWHQVEHTVLLAGYLATGTEGLPGLFAAGGLVAGGLPLARADLHFLYNIAETAPLVAAYLVERRRAMLSQPRRVSAGIVTVGVPGPRSRPVRRGSNRPPGQRTSLARAISASSHRGQSPSRISTSSSAAVSGR